MTDHHGAQPPTAPRGGGGQPGQPFGYGAPQQPSQPAAGQWGPSQPAPGQPVPGQPVPGQWSPAGQPGDPQQWARPAGQSWAQPDDTAWAAYPPQAGPPTGGHQFGAAPQTGPMPALAGGGWQQQPATGKGGRKPWLWITAALAAVALAVGAIFIVRSLTATPGGAASPSEAVEQFATGAAELDYAAVLGMLNPHEVYQLADVMSKAEDRMEAEGLTPPGMSSAADAITVEIVGLELDEQQVRDDVAFVTVKSGTLNWTFDPSKLEEGAPSTGTGAVPQSGQFELAEIFGPTGMRIATVETDGSWFISLTTTAMERARTAMDLPEPNWDSEPAVGAAVSDPTQLVTEFANRFNQRDVAGIIGLLSQQELPTLRYYAEVFLQDFDIDEELGQASISVVDSDLSVEEAGDGKSIVWIDSITLDLTNEDGTTEGGSLEGWCDAENPQDCEDLATVLGVDKPFFVAVEEDGGWRLSPLGTLVQLLDFIVQNGSGEGITDALGMPGGVPGGMPGTGSGAGSGGTTMPTPIEYPVGEQFVVDLEEMGDEHSVLIAGDAGMCVEIKEIGNEDAEYYVDVEPGAETCEGSTSLGNPTEGSVIPSDGTLELSISSTVDDPVYATILVKELT